MSAGTGQHARAAAAFRAGFGREPIWAARAPGRVNLIGEHTDYNDGFVLPIAIDLECVAVGAPGEDPSVSRVYSEDAGLLIEFDARRTESLRRGGPLRYVAGVFAEFARLGHDRNLDVAVASSVPIGGGLSSSASLEVAVAVLLEQAAGLQLPRPDLVLLCQRAEHEYAGVPCGIMDQFASAIGREGHALLIDCRSQGVRPVRMPPETNAAVLVANTNIRHELAGGQYAQRRATCARAASKLGVGTLRDADQPLLDARAPVLSEEERRCARHVIGENARVLDAVAALEEGDLESMGGLMLASHASLRDDYRVSCAELDTLVNALGSLDGVYGARMTGAGFGGCCVAVVAPPSVERVCAAAGAEYSRAHGRACTFHVVRAAQGAGPLPV
jgi:galactokinase